MERKWTAVKNDDIYEIAAWEVRDDSGKSIVKLHTEGGCESDPYAYEQCAAMAETMAKRVAELLTVFAGIEDPAAHLASLTAKRDGMRAGLLRIRVAVQFGANAITIDDIARETLEAAEALKPKEGSE